MVRAIIEYADADYERLRKTASDRGVSVESLIAAESLKHIPQPDDEVRPFTSWEEFFSWCDQQKFSLNGWKWNRDELYDRKILR